MDDGVKLFNSKNQFLRIQSSLINPNKVALKKKNSAKITSVRLLLIYLFVSNTMKTFLTKNNCENFYFKQTEINIHDGYLNKILSILSTFSFN